MACNLTQGFTLACGRDNTGGIKQFHIVEFSKKGSITTVSGAITAMTLTSGSFFTYEVVSETAELTEASPVDVKNGTVFFEQKLSAVLHKLTTAKRNELFLVVQSPCLVIVEDSKGNNWLLGEGRGVDLTKRDAKTGKDLGDFAGYEIEFTGKESDPMKIVAQAVAFTLAPSHI